VQTVTQLQPRVEAALKSLKKSGGAFLIWDFLSSPARSSQCRAAQPCTMQAKRDNRPVIG